MTQLVSVIIPCFNAERWIGEAIQSCLNQTYAPIEIIVIDDGSTDRSLEVIKSFGNRVRWESGQNRGGNHARNRGFAISSGRYIQFLDADDYLLAEKIARQVAFLEASGADVVYGDWRHEHFRPNGSSWLEEIAVAGEQDDLLASLLSGWWVAPAAVLFRREAVINAGGWDESLKAAQDRDFMISVAMAGGQIAYQPGCYAIYRRYGNVTVGTKDPFLFLSSHGRVLEKAQARLQSAGRLSIKYERVLSRSFASLARSIYDLSPRSFDIYIQRALALYPHVKPDGSAAYRLLATLLGFRRAEAIASARRRIRFFRRRRRHNR